MTAFRFMSGTERLIQRHCILKNLRRQTDSKTGIPVQIGTTKACVLKEHWKAGGCNACKRTKNFGILGKPFTLLRNVTNKEERHLANVN
jgi:hypothetical protein